MDKKAVLVVGSITADLTAFAVRRPSPGETLLGEDFTLVLGVAREPTRPSPRLEPVPRPPWWAA
jgi:hypothetical protein